jgi:hypothetical protein
MGVMKESRKETTMENKFKDRAEFVQWFDSEEGKQVAQPLFDQKVTAGIKAYQAKHPDRENLGDRLGVIEGKILEKDMQLKSNELRFFAFKKCTEAGVDFDLLDGFALTDEKAITEKIEQLGTMQSISIDRIINSRLASAQKKPESSQLSDNHMKKDQNYYALEAELRERGTR